MVGCQLATWVGFHFPDNTDTTPLVKYVDFNTVLLLTYIEPADFCPQEGSGSTKRWDFHKQYREDSRTIELKVQGQREGAEDLGVVLAFEFPAAVGVGVAQFGIAPVDGETGGEIGDEGFFRD